MPVSVCFVCLGNICRSPTAEAVFRALVAEAGLDDAFVIDSAGTAAYHTGSHPDRRSSAAAAARGITLQGRARQFDAADFERFDYVVAMDRNNRSDLLALTLDPDARTKIRLLRDYVEQGPRDADVPDPYYGGSDGFDRVLDICDEGCRALLAEIRRTHGL